jgi:hypothetical protein
VPRENELPAVVMIDKMDNFKKVDHTDRQLFHSGFVTMLKKLTVTVQDILRLSILKIG